MTFPAVLIFLFFVGQAVWRSILKPGVYPPSIKWYLKWFHALILFYLAIHALFSLDELFWLIHHHSEFFASFSSHSNTTRGPVGAVMDIIRCTSGLALPFICDPLAKRREKALKWLFIVWPINFLSLIYFIVSSEIGKNPIWTIAVLVSVLSGIFFASVLFYLSSTVRKNLFEDKNGMEKLDGRSPSPRPSPRGEGGTLERF